MGVLFCLRGSGADIDLLGCIGGLNRDLLSRAR